MADRTSARAFGDVFRILASTENIPEETRRTIAARVYHLTRNYDFSDGQMGVDEELESLGLGRWKRRPTDTDDGEWEYGPEKPVESEDDGHGAGPG